MRKTAGTIGGVLAALALAACGGGSETSSSGGGTDPDAATGAKKQGGDITIAQTSQPDYLDPALSYTVNGWEPMWLVYTPLLTYPRKEGEAGSQVQPGLAESLPKISADGRTYQLKLRKGLKYSDGQDVKASDFEHAIKRVLNLESGGSSFFQVIEGADRYIDGGKEDADISGITADDATGDIQIKLTEPTGSFPNVLAMNFAALVPGDTPFRNMTKTPPAGVGPYELTESVPNRQFVMTKVKGFNVPDVPKGNVDTITTKIVKSASRQAQDLESGKLDYIQDPPPSNDLPRFKQTLGPKGQFKTHTTASTFYFFLNAREKPFDNKLVRQAVATAVDKTALARIFGGLLTPSCTFLPPGVPGHSEENDKSCPYGSGRGDVAKAKQMIQQAGAAGQEVTVWGNNDDPTPRVTSYYADLLNQIGLKATPKTVDGGVYFATIGNEKTKAQTGFANWFQDFPNPSNFMFLVDGASIQPTNNQNFGNVDDPAINKEIAALNQETDTQKVADRWAAVDRKLVEEAYVVPYGNRQLSTSLSARMNTEGNVFHPLYYNDYSSFALK